MSSFRDMKAIKDSSSDINYLIQMKSSLTDLEFETLSFFHFSNYLKNKKVIPAILNNGNYTYELSIIWKMANEAWFTNPLQYFLSHARNAFENNRSEFIDSIESYYPIVHESLENYHDTCFLYNENHELQNREIARGYFRMMGDMIESTHYLLLRFVYNTLTLSNKSEIFKKDRNISFGKMIAELINMENFNFLLKGYLSNIPLNQWRNISQHSSYKYNHKKGEVICTYGKNLSIDMKLSDLRNLIIKLNTLQQWLKICFDFTYLEFIDSITLSPKTLRVSNESWLSQLGNILPLNGYSILDVNKILDHWTIKIKDNNNLGIEGFKNSVELFMPILKGFYLNKIKLTIELFNINEKSIQKLYLEPKIRTDIYQIK